MFVLDLPRRTNRPPGRSDEPEYSGLPGECRIRGRERVWSRTTPDQLAQPLECWAVPGFPEHAWNPDMTLPLCGGFRPLNRMPGSPDGAGSGSGNSQPTRKLGKAQHSKAGAMLRTRDQEFPRPLLSDRSASERVRWGMARCLTDSCREAD